MRPTNSFLKRILLLAAFSLPCCLATYGQDPSDVALGMSPGVAYNVQNIDSVAATSGRLVINIPILVDHSQRGQLNFNYEVINNSSGAWYVNCTSPQTDQGCSWRAGTYGLGGLGFVASGVLTGPGNITERECCFGNADVYNTFSVRTARDSAGPLHQLGTISTSPYVAESIDGSGIRVAIDSNGYYFLTRSDGLQFHLTGSGPSGSRVEDPNGNNLTTSVASPNTAGAQFGSYPFAAGYSNQTTTDTLGRVWSWTETTNFTNCPVTATDAYIWSTPGVNGGQRNFKFCLSTVTFSTNFHVLLGSQYVTEYSSSGNSLTGIVLPDLTTWRFDYTSYGDIAKIYLPTGGTITYSWTTIDDYLLYAGNMGIDKLRSLTSRTVYDGTNSNTWNYSNIGTANPATVTDPLQNDTVYTTAGSCTGGYTTQVQKYSGTGSSRTLLSTVTTCNIDLNDPYADDMDVVGSPVITASSEITLPSTQESQVTYTYDSGFSFYDTNQWAADGPGPFTGLYGLVQKTSYSDWNNNTPGPILSNKNTTYLALSNASNASSYLGANLLTYPYTQTVTDSSGHLCTETDYGYDASGYVDSSGVTEQHGSAPTSGILGNVTSVTQKLFISPCTSSNPSYTSLTTYNHVFDTGMLHSTTDPLSNTTTFGYTSSSYYGAYPPTITNAKNQVTHYTYDTNTGLTLNMTDPNNQETFYTWDNMLRLLTATYPDTGQTSITYNYSSNVFTGDTVTKKVTSSLNASTTQVTDGLGREIQRQTAVQSSTTCSSGYSYVDTVYDGDGRVYKVSNPDCTSTSSDDVNSTFYYDGFGRPCLTVPQDGTANSGSSCPTSRPAGDVLTTYSGNCSTVADEAGNVRKSCTDGMGRVNQVFEPNPTNNGSLIYETDYTYDPNSNLTYAQQKGNDSNSAHWRPRSFTYDSLSRLTIASNPESGTVCYGSYSGSTCLQNGYDGDGNLIFKTDARGKTINYSPSGSPIDSLGRVTEKTYSDTTPTPQFVYDTCPSGGCPTGISPQNAVGRLVEAYTPTTKSFYSYDPMGRIAEVWECTPVNCGTSFVAFAYGYNDLGEQTSASYNGSFTLSQAYDTGGNDYQLTSSLSNSNNPGTLATVTSFTAAGLPQVTSLGNGLKETIVYNSRLQPCRMNVQSSSTSVTSCTGSAPSGNVQDYQFGYNSGTSNNGNLASWSGTGQQVMTRSYGYDTLNRISTFSDTATGAICTGLSWSYDPWANRTAQTVTGGTCNSFSASYNTLNQITNTNFGYDLSGDLTNDGSYTYFYDAEGRVSGAAGATYLYDALGRRVEKTTSTQVHYFYDASGNIAREENGSGGVLTDYLYIGGRYLAEYSGSQTYFVHHDHLGSTRLVTNYAGSECSSIDYMPFGEQTTSGSCAPTHRFTGKERDSESGLDNFGARYDSSQYGRFMSPDPMGIFFADAANPQSWNQYSYVVNNPLSYTDPDGLHCVQYADGDYHDDDTGGETCDEANDPSHNNQSSSNTTAQADNYDTTGSYGSSTSSNAGIDPGILPMLQGRLSLLQSPKTPASSPNCVQSVFNPSCKPPSKPSCPAVFRDSLLGYDSKDKPQAPAGLGPEDAATASAAAFAARHVIQRGLVAPIQSSIVRNILLAGEVASDILSWGPVIYSEANALIDEGAAWKSGACTTIWSSN